MPPIDWSQTVKIPLKCTNAYLSPQKSEHVNKVTDGRNKTDCDKTDDRDIKIRVHMVN